MIIDKKIDNCCLGVFIAASKKQFFLPIVVRKDSDPSQGAIFSKTTSNQFLKIYYLTYIKKPNKPNNYK